MSCYFYLLYLLDMNCECNVISLYFLCFSVNGSVCFVCCVSDRVSPNNLQYLLVSVCFAWTVYDQQVLMTEDHLNDIGCYFIIEYYGVLSVGGGALLDKPCMVFQRMCVVPVIPACSFHRFCFCMLEVISSFSSLRAG